MSLALGRARLAVLHISSAGCPLRPARLISVFVLVTLVLVDAVHVLCSPARLIGSPSLPSLSLSFSLPESRQKPKSDHLPRRADQCNLHTHVIANKNKSPAEKRSRSIEFLNALVRRSSRCCGHHRDSKPSQPSKSAAQLRRAPTTQVANSSRTWLGQRSTHQI